MRSKKLKNLHLTAELVFKEDTQERFYSDLGVEFDPTFDDEGTELHVHETNPRDLQAHFYNEVDMVPIAEMKKLIEAAEVAGANYIKVFFHGDHQDYEVMGINVHKESTTEYGVRRHVEHAERTLKMEEAKMKILNYAKENGFKRVILE